MTAILSISDINTTINHEPRIHDLRLAEALGFERPRNIRLLIQRIEKALESFGNLFCFTVKQNTRGRPGKEYWLNEKQALYLCTKSEAPNAIDITIEMVEVFYAVKSGQTVPVRAHVRRKPQRQLQSPEQFATSIPQQDLFITGLGHLSMAAERNPEMRLLQTALACLKRFDTVMNEPLSLALVYRGQAGRAQS